MGYKGNEKWNCFLCKYLINNKNLFGKFGWFCKFDHELNLMFNPGNNGCGEFKLKRKGETK